MKRRITDKSDTETIVKGALSQRPVRPIEFNAKIKVNGKMNALPTEISVAKNDFSTAVR